MLDDTTGTLLVALGSWILLPAWLIQPWPPRRMIAMLKAPPLPPVLPTYEWQAMLLRWTVLFRRLVAAFGLCMVSALVAVSVTEQVDDPSLNGWLGDALGMFGVLASFLASSIFVDLSVRLWRLSNRDPETFGQRQLWGDCLVPGLISALLLPLMFLVVIEVLVR